jgi:hypothetical protein
VNIIISRGLGQDVIFFLFKSFYHRVCNICDSQSCLTTVVDMALDSVSYLVDTLDIVNDLFRASQNPRP